MVIDDFLPIKLKSGRSGTCAQVFLKKILNVPVEYTTQQDRAVHRIFSPGGSKAYMPKKVQDIKIIINNDTLKVVNIHPQGIRVVHFPNFYLGSGFGSFGTKNLDSVRLFSKKNSTLIRTHLCMFRAFLLNRRVHAFVSLYKSLNILKEQLELIYKDEIFLSLTKN